MNKYLFFIGKWLIIPLILIAVFFYVSFLFNPYEPFSIVTYSEKGTDTFTSSKPIGKPLYKGDKVYGSFTSIDPNLGIVLVRFWNFENISKDVLIFRIKEKGSNTWYYEGRYKVDQFQPNEYFTFGFPIVRGSKGKQYEFELESTAGKKGDAIAISRQKPYFATRYKFFISENKRNPIATGKFIVEKIIDLLTDEKSVLLSLIYLFPFIAYAFTFLIRSKERSKVFYILLSIYIFSLITFNKFPFLPEITIITVILYWVFGIVRFGLGSSVSFMCAIVFLILTAFASTIDSFSSVTQKIGVFFYWFLLSGTVERFIEMKWDKTYKVGWEKFFRFLIS